MREIEGLLSSGSPSALRRARGMSKAYLRRYEGHMNAVLLAASAAQMDGDLSEAMSLIKHAISIEPQNARLHARAAALYLAKEQHVQAVDHLETALSAEVGTHDAEDEAGRAKLEDMLKECRLRMEEE